MERLRRLDPKARMPLPPPECGNVAHINNNEALAMLVMRRTVPWQNTLHHALAQLAGVLV